MFVIGMFAPQPVVPKVPAVVAPEDDNRIVSQLEFLKLVEEPTDLRIDVGGAGIIAMD